MNNSYKKAQIRDVIREKRKMIDKDSISYYGNILVEQFKDADDELTSIIKSSNVIALYSAVNGELTCSGLDNYFRKMGKTICYPRVEGENIDFYQVDDIAKQMKKGAYNIPEPASDCCKIAPENIDIIVVPAIAFNDEGIRLGQGGGFYDRYLDRCEKIDKIPYTIGICYDFQIYSAIPVEEHDRGVDCIMCIELGDDE